MGSCFHKKEIQLVRYFINSAIPDFQYNGIKSLCFELENGKSIPAPYHDWVIGELLRFVESANTKLRRWTYKAFALLHASSTRGILMEKIAANEHDPENVDWAIAAYATLEGEERCMTFLSSCGRLDEHYLLPMRLFIPVHFRVPRYHQLRLPGIEDDPLQAQWYSLLFGYGADLADIHPKPIELISALNNHHNSLVCEYSIWALHRNSSTTAKQAQIDLDSISSLPPNVRRWTYRLLGKDAATNPENAYRLANSVSCEHDSRAREGLALSLQNVSPSLIEETVLDWYDRELDTLVRAALTSHLVRFADKNPAYVEALSNAYTADKPRNDEDRMVIEAIAVKQRKHSVLDMIAPKKNPQMFIVMENHDSIVNVIGSSTNVTIGNQSITRSGGEILKPMVESLKGINLGPIRKEHPELVGEIEDVASGARPPTKERLFRLKDALAPLVESMPHVAKLVAGIQEVIKAIHN